jgi:hypothetical protein
MKRLCVIGDSHTMALKAGWDGIAHAHRDLDIVFFAAGGRRLSELDVADGALVPANGLLAKALRLTSGDQDRIGGGYDGYILCGLALSLTNLLPIIKCFRSEAQHRDDRMALSDACYRASFVGTCRASLMAQTLAKLRRITAAPAAMMTQPLPAMRPWKKGSPAFGEAAIVAQFMNAALSEMARGFGARHVRQPDETLGESPLTTAQVFFQDSVQMFDKPDDQLHANARYGAIMLEQALAALR